MSSRVIYLREKCPEFRTKSPDIILLALYKEQNKFNRNPQAPDDFKKVDSRALFGNAADLGLSISLPNLHLSVTKLAVAGRIAIHSNPDHAQAYLYSITHQGIHCCKCKFNQMLSLIHI